MTRKTTKYQTNNRRCAAKLAALFFLAFIQPAHAQTTTTIRLADYRNAAFDSLHVRSCKEYTSSKGRKQQLQKAAVYNQNGYMATEDTFIYDSLGQLAVQQRISYAYDGSEMKLFHIHIIAGQSDTLMIQTFQFDDRHRLKQKSDWKSYNDYTITETYDYDEHDQCTLISVSGSGATFNEYRYEREYDQQGNVLRITCNGQFVESNSYDPAGRLISTDSGNYRESISYDDNGNLSSRTTKCSDLVNQLFLCRDMTYSYTYNRKNQPTRYSARPISDNKAPTALFIGESHKTTYTYHKNGLLRKWNMRSEGYRWECLYSYEFE